MVWTGVGFRTLEPAQLEELLAWGMSKPVKMGSPQGQAVGGWGEDYNDSHICCTPLTNVTLLLWRSGLFPHFSSCGVPYSHPFRLSLHSQQLYPPGFSLQNPAPSPPRQQETHDAGWCVQDCAQIWLCPAFHRPAAAFPFISDPLKLLLCSRWFSHHGGFLWVYEPLLTLSSLAEVLVPFCFIFSFL